MSIFLITSIWGSWLSFQFLIYNFFYWVIFTSLLNDTNLNVVTFIRFMIHCRSVKLFVIWLISSVIQGGLCQWFHPLISEALTIQNVMNFITLSLPCRLFGFNAGKMKMDERINLSMSDPDLVPLIIQVL
jgi:hypothetical protein